MPLVIVLAAACLVLAVTACRGGGPHSAGPAPSVPGKKTTTRGADASTESAVLVPKSGLPKVDYTIDLDTGVTTPLPQAIIRSLARSRGLLDGAIEAARLSTLGHRYAASPDGSQLAYVGTSVDDGTPQIFTARIDGTRIRQMTDDPTGAWSPAWSPDGTKIAYNGSWISDIRELFVLDVATGKSTQITHETHRRDWDPQFTPDGSSLIYTGGSSSRPVIRTVPVRRGGESTLLIAPSRGLQDAGNGSLSPDGSLVTFLAGGFPEEGPAHCGPCRFVANAEGTDRRVIPGYEANPAGTWSPDGSRIVDLSCRGIENAEDCSPPSSVTVVDVATGRASHVALGYGAIWLDDHTLLVEAR
jgi:Tol biopolymer transport system component